MKKNAIYITADIKRVIWYLKYIHFLTAQIINKVEPTG